MASTQKTVEFYYDVISPYSYLSLVVLKRYLDSGLWNGVQVILRPCSIASVALAAKNKTPGMVPIKGKYTHRDMIRLCLMMDLPYAPYRGKDALFVMQHSVTAMYFVAAVAQLQPQHLWSISTALSSGYWSEAVGDMNDEAGWRKICSKHNITAAATEQLIEASKSAAAKAMIDSNSNHIVTAGGFGAPCYLVHSPVKTATTIPHPAAVAATTPAAAVQHVEFVFGQDRTDVIAWMLGVPFYGNKIGKHPAPTDGKDVPSQFKKAKL